MPLISLKKINTNCSRGLWKISESNEELWKALNPSLEEEIVYLKNIRHPGKQNESLAARLLVKSILEQWNLPYLGIQKNELLSPSLIDSSFRISLSHSHQYAVAIVHQSQKTGIDIEQIDEKILKIAPKFLSEKELHFADDKVEMCTLLWTAKESLYKLYGEKKLIFKSDMVLAEPFELKSGDFLEMYLKVNQQEKKYKLYYKRLEDYYITYTFD